MALGVQTDMATPALNQYGSHELKKEFLEPAIRGRLVVFFPGSHEKNVYRLLDARDGWGYMAFPITLNEVAYT